MNTTRQSSRIQSLTSDYFSGLHGLRQIAVGIMLLFSVLAFKLTAPWNAPLLGVLLLLLGISWRRIGVYYERRFGHVEIRREIGTSVDGGSFFKRALFWGLVILSYLVSQGIFHGSFRWGWLFGFLGLFFVSFFAVEGRRWYYLSFSAPFFVLAIVSGGARAGGKAVALGLYLFPITLAIAGIVDYLVMARHLPGADSNGDS